MMFGLNPDEIDAGNEAAAAQPYNAERDTPPGFFEGSGAVMKNIPETSASGLALASNVIGGKIYGEQQGDQQFQTDLVDLQKKLRPDPATTGLLGQVLYGVGKVLPQAAVGSIAGPVGAAGLVGVTQGIEETKRLESEGVDPSTATKAGTVEGVTQGIGVIMPAAVGTRIGTKIITGAGANVTLGAFQRGTTGAILRANGYHDMAEQYRVLDGAALLTDSILGGSFGLLHTGSHAELHVGKNTHDPVNDNHPGDLDLGLAANDVRQFELDSAPGIPTDPESRNAHAKAMNVGIGQLLAGRDVDIGDTLDNTTFLTRQGNPELTAAFKEAAAEDGLPAILQKNNMDGEAAVQSVVERSLREAGRSQIEAESVAPLFARTLARFSEPFGQPVSDAFNRSLLEFQQLDEQGRTVALGNNVTSLLNDVEAIGRGETLDPSVHAAAADFGDRLAQLGITPEQARLMPADQLLDQVYNVGKPAVEGAENLATLEVGQNEDGQTTVGLRQSPQAVNPEHQAAITDRLTQGVPEQNVSPLGFVSKMERVLDMKLNKTGTVDQFREQLDAFQKSGQYKPDERFWSGIDDFLDNMKEMDGADAKMDKQAILDFLKNNRFKLIEHGENDVGNGPALDEIRLRDFREDSELQDPDDSYIRENADEYYKEDILKELTEENAALPEDEQKSPEEIEREADDKAYDRALDSYNEDPYNQITYYTHDIELPDGTNVDMEIREQGDGDYVEYKVGDRDWKDARSVDDALQSIHLALSEDYGVNFEGTDSGPQFEEYTGKGGSNYRFFRLATDELKGGTFTKGGHYPEENVLLHMRTKDRVGPNGEKMLFIEEIQSDIHQDALNSKRKTGIAYRTDVTPEMRDEATDAHSAAEEVHTETRQKLYDVEIVMNDAIKHTIPALPDHGVREVRENVVETIKKLRDERNNNVTPDDTAEMLERQRNEVGTFVDTTKIYNAISKATDSEGADNIDYGVGRMAKIIIKDVETEYTSGAGTHAPYPWMEAVKNRVDHLRAMYGESSVSVADIDKAEQFLYRQPEALIVPADKMREAYDRALGKFRDQTIELMDKLTEAKNAMNKANSLRHAQESAPPGAPFAKTWREVGFKRLLARAADEGYESVGWTTGTQQNVRYNLSNFIDGLKASEGDDGAGNKVYILKSDRRVMKAIEQSLGREDAGEGFVRVNDAELEQALGKQGADAVRSQAGFSDTDIDFAKEIEVGGEKKGNLYDQMLPQDAGKILKKLDPSIKVEEKPYSITERNRDIEKIWYAPLTDKAKTEITKGFELFQKERGAITFNRASAKDFEGRLKKVVIEFGTAADESTAAHEFSHWATATHRMYAELARKRIEAGDLSPEVKRIADDWETLKKEVGAKDDVFTADQEEKIASWFEGYMRTGEAPSDKLQAIFDRFKDWLTKIYQDITGRGMEVSPVVKDVFDRWLADADEIKAKQEKANVAAREAHVDDTNVANMGETGGEPGADTGEKAAIDPIQQIIAEKPDLMIADDNGNAVPAQEAMDNAQAEVEQAQKDASLFEVAINCFLRHSDA